MNEKGSQVNFEEYEIVNGEDDVEVPMKYVGKVDGNTIQGNNEHEDPECHSTFKLDRIATAPAKGNLQFSYYYFYYNIIFILLNI